MNGSQYYNMSIGKYNDLTIFFTKLEFFKKKSSQNLSKDIQSQVNEYNETIEQDMKTFIYQHA